MGYVIFLLSAFLLFVFLFSEVSIRVLNYCIEIRINFFGISFAIKKINIKEIDWISVAEKIVDGKLDNKEFSKLHLILLKYFSQYIMPVIKANRKTLNKVRCKRLKSIINWGSSDPAITGIIFGLINTIMSVFVIIVYQIFIIDFHKPELSIKANFETSQISWEHDCIFVISLVHIINAGLRTFAVIFKNKISF